MLRRLNSRGEGLPGGRKISHYQSAINNGISNIVLSLPWLIAYFAVVGGVDPTTCTGTPYNFGRFARWAYLGAAISELILFPLRLRVAKKKDAGEESSVGPLSRLLGNLLSSFVFGVWIYACTALSHRGDCLSDSLVSLLWATVLIPAIMLALVCCCCCCILLTAGAAMGLAKSMDNQPGQIDTHGHAQGTEANQLQRDLEEEKRKIEMQMAENQNVQKVDMA